MSSFQPINKARRRSKDAAGNNSPAPAVSPIYEPESLLALEACASNLMRAAPTQVKPSREKKRKSIMVVVPANTPPQALISSEDSVTPQTPPRKKRKTVIKTSKALREQAPRDAKSLPTIEHSAISTPATGTECDSNWSISSEYLGGLDSDLSPQISHRRSPRHRPSSTSLTELSSTDQCIGSSLSTHLHRPSQYDASGNAVKREGTTSPDRFVIRPRFMTPSQYNKEIREKRLQEEEVVELPPAEWAYQQYVRTKEEERKNVLAMEKIWKEELRKEKGKEPEHRLELNVSTLSKAPSKRKAEGDRETEITVKRQKKSHKKVNKKSVDVDASLQPVQNATSRLERPLLDSRGDQGGKADFSGKQSKIIHEDPQPGAVLLQIASEVLSSEPEGSALKSNDGISTRLKGADKEGFIPTGPKAWRAKQTQTSQSWQQACNRREVEVAAPRPRRCKCDCLPPYFKQPDLFKPSLADFEGGKAEFLCHVRQVSDCEGHNQLLIDSCRSILIQEQRNEWRKAESSSGPNGKERDNGSRDAIGCAGDWLSSSRYAKPSRDTQALYNRIGQRDKGLPSEQMARGRQQSSIEPKSFYGKQPEYRVPPTFESSPSITDKALTNEKHRDAERSGTTKDRITSPDSSPASGSQNRRKSTSARLPIETHVEDDWRPMLDDDDPIFPTPKPSPLKVVQRLSKTVPEAPKDRPQPPRYFNAQRRRHQSVPASVSRTSTVNERDTSPQSARPRHENALQELSNNAILLDMNQKLTSVEKVLLERLPAKPRTQNAPVRPATTPPAAIITDSGNTAEQPRMRRKKKASVAERQLRLPVLDRDVPMDLRLPDQDLIDIGRIINHYERHTKAPYAFSWHGRLYAEYTHLLDPRSNGVPVWTAEEIKRVRR